MYAVQQHKEDTRRLAILVDDHQVGEVPGDALGNDPLQGQTFSVVHVGIWDYGGQLLTKLHRPLQAHAKKTVQRVEQPVFEIL